MRLPDPDFYSLDTKTVAGKLLGMRLTHESPEGTVSGIIVETEAYLSAGDAACHAARGRTKRNTTMFGPSGRAYVYFIYGNYHCLNVVTGPVGKGEAVLIRAVEPLEGLELMRKRRGADKALTDLTSGPGKLCIAYNIDRLFDGHDLRAKPLYISACGGGEEKSIDRANIRVTPRIGISVAGDLLLRYVVAGNDYLSRREPLV